jgi:aryl-alcohol dehydrogenase-like predicted oxidoreductase
MTPRSFGNTGVEVSPIALGCWIFGVDWWGHRTQEDCDRLCAHALDQGITFFDNGDAYGNGRAETLFGNWLKTLPASKRDAVVIGGKFGYDFYSDPGEKGSHRERKQDFSPAFLRKALEQSLDRLGVDCIDVYTAHNIKMPGFNDELFTELDKIQQEGKVRAWGVSLGPAIGWREEGFKAMGDHGAQVVQTVYNYLEQHPGRELCEMAEATGAGVMARVQDNSGVLKGVIKADTKLDQNDHRKFRDMPWRVYGPQKVEKIRPIFENHGMTVHQFACKWLLQSSPALTTITATLLNEAEVDEVVAATGKPDLTSAEMRELHELYERDFDLPAESHACDLKSSVGQDGKTRSDYVAPPTLVA